MDNADEGVLCCVQMSGGPDPKVLGAEPITQEQPVSTLSLPVLTCSSLNLLLSTVFLLLL